MSTWLCSFSDVTVTSKYCIQYMNYKLPEGCYVMSADQGYIKRCYCYSHWCNAASKNSNRTLVMAVVQVAFVAAMLSWIRGSWSRVIFIVVRIVKIRQLYTLYIPVDNILRSVIVCWCKKCENIKVSRIVILHNGVHGYICFTILWNLMKCWLQHRNHFILKLCRGGCSVDFRYGAGYY